MSVTPNIGDTIGDWLLVERLGAGGMGIVFRATHRITRQTSAIKVLTGAGVSDAAARLRNEARILKGLVHVNIAQYYGYIDHGGMPCMVMRYVEGATLADQLRHNGALQPENALRVFRELADAVGYLHGRGILHRDLKPENIKIDAAGHPVLLDFGIARDEHHRSLTSTHSVIGTLGCLAPEQLEGKPATPRSDIWALGVLLVQMLTGVAPFNADSLTEARRCQCRGWRKVVPASTLPLPMVRVLDRCLAVKPSDRYADAAELAGALKNIDTSPQTKQGTSLRYKPAVTAMAIVAVAGIGVWLVITSQSAPPPRSSTSEGKSALGPGPIQTKNTNRTPSSEPYSVGAKPASPLSGGAMADVRVDTIDGKADVYSDGRLLGQTPFRSRMPVGKVVNLELRRPGYHAEIVHFEVRPIENQYDVALQRIR